MAYDVALVLGFGAIAFVMAYMAFNLDREEHGILQILFMFLAFFSILNVHGSMLVLLEEQAITAFNPMIEAQLNVFIWGLYLTLGYIFLVFMYRTALKMIYAFTKSKEKRLGLGGEGV